jgi:hypothetical protein
MRHDGRHPSSSAAPFAVPDLHVCRGCRWTFVVPVAMVDVLGPDRYLVELQCTNCGLTVVEPHDEQVLEALDRELDRQAADMRAALEVWEVTRQAEEVDAFAQALQDDHILPEDF